MQFLFVQKIRVAKTRASVNRRLVIILERLSAGSKLGDISESEYIPNDLDESHSTNKTDKPTEQMRFWLPLSVTFVTLSSRYMSRSRSF